MLKKLGSDWGAGRGSSHASVKKSRALYRQSTHQDSVLQSARMAVWGENVNLPSIAGCSVDMGKSISNRDPFFPLTLADEILTGIHRCQKIAAGQTKMISILRTQVVSATDY